MGSEGTRGRAHGALCCERSNLGAERRLRLDAAGLELSSDSEAKGLSQSIGKGKGTRKLGTRCRGPDVQEHHVGLCVAG